MSNFVTGEVQFISKSPKGYFSAKVNDVWYGVGMGAPKFDKGNEVSFTFTQKGDFKIIDMPSVEISSANAAPKTSTGGKSQSDRDKYWTDKAESDKIQQRIREYHAARSTAVECVTALVNAGAIKLPATENKKYDALMSVVDELTTRFYSDIEGRFHTDIPSASDASREEED